MQVMAQDVQNPQSARFNKKNYQNQLQFMNLQKTRKIVEKELPSGKATVDVESIDCISGRSSEIPLKRLSVIYFYCIFRARFLSSIRLFN